MKKLMPVIFIVLLLSAGHSDAQISKLSGQWSLMINGNFMTNYGISASMRGTAQEFSSDMNRDYNNSKYPFGDGNTRSLNFGTMLSYRLSGSNFSPYFAWNLTYFDVDNLVQTAHMFINSFSLGCEYSFGDISDLWNTFARLGINMNFIGGGVTNWGYDAIVSPLAIRYGCEAEAGGRLNIPSTPLSLEVSAVYTDANIIGKGYRAPSALPPTPIDERALNDGANPSDPNDTGRTIDYLTLKFGVRLWF